MKNIKEKNDQRLYELSCLVGLRNSERIAGLAKKIEDWVDKKKGEMVEIGKEETAEVKGGKGIVWVDKRRLAYPINDDKAGYYLYSWLRLDPKDIEELKRYLKLEKEVIRFAVLTGGNITRFHPSRDAVTINELGELVSKQIGSGIPAGRARARVEAPKMPFRREKIEKVEIEEKAPVVPEIKAEPKEEVTPARPARLPAGQAGGEEKIMESKPEEKKTEEVVELKEKVEAFGTEKKDKREKPVKIKEQVAKEAKEKPEKEEVLKQVQDDKKENNKRKKISLEDLDKRLDDILNEDIL